MKNFKLQFIVHVSSSKYREFMNLMEKEINLDKPFGCASRMICQSIADSNVFDYTEHWYNLESLELYLKSANFRALNGALKLLTNIKDIHVQECTEIEKTKILIN